MKKMMMIAACAALAGCQTVVEIEKNPEVVHPVQAVVQIEGKQQIINTGYQVTSGGWDFKARSPLYADEALKGLKASVSTNGVVQFELAEYQRDLSTNAVVMVKTIFDGSVNLVSACAKAYATIQSGGATDAAGAVAEKIAKYFKSKGGDEKASTVIADQAAKTLTVTDGKTAVQCDANGNCSECVGGACSEPVK